MGKIMKEGKQYGVGGDGQILFETISGTTSVSGALIWRDITRYQCLSVRSLSGNNIFAFIRGDGYFTVFTITDGALKPLANTQVSLQVAYCKKNFVG